jgi:hypothetical protein
MATGAIHTRPNGDVRRATVHLKPKRRNYLPVLAADVLVSENCIRFLLI